VQSLSVTTNQEAIRALFRVTHRYQCNLPPVPGVFPDYPAPMVRDGGDGRELVLMRWGMPPPQHHLAALARLAEAREPLPGPVQQLCRVRAGAEPDDEEKGRGLVRTERGQLYFER
jgi:putative SOS response-associated peptidase YedK